MNVAFINRIREQIDKIRNNRKLIVRLHTAKLFIGAFRKKFSEINITGLSESLAFTTIVSIVPLFIIFFSVLGSLTKDGEYQAKILMMVSNYIIPEYITDVFDQLQKLSQNSVALGVVGFPTLVIVGMFLFVKVDRSINLIWKTGKFRKLKDNLVAFLMSVFLGPVLIAFLISIPTYINAIPYMDEYVVQNPITGFITSEALPIIVVSLFFLILFVYLPITKVKLIPALIGAFTSSMLMWINNSLLGVYLINFTKYDLIYGSLSILPIILLWTFVMWLTVLVGALVAFIIQNFNAMIIEHKDFLSKESHSVLNMVMIILVILCSHFKDRKNAVSIRELEDQLGIPSSKLLGILESLVAKGLVNRVYDPVETNIANATFQPACDPEKITLKELGVGYHSKFEAQFDNPVLKDFIERIQLHEAFESKITVADLISKPDKLTNFIGRLANTPPPAEVNTN